MSSRRYSMRTNTHAALTTRRCEKNHSLLRLARINIAPWFGVSGTYTADRRVTGPHCRPHPHRGRRSTMNIVSTHDEPVSLAVMKHLVTKLPECDAQAFTDASAALIWCRN